MAHHENRPLDSIAGSRVVALISTMSRSDYGPSAEHSQLMRELLLACDRSLRPRFEES